MPDFMSQDEIDKLLSQVSRNDEIHEDMQEPEEEHVYVSHDSSKVYRIPEKPVENFKYGYRSPVLKAEDIVYNPPPHSRSSLDVKAVYSLEEYAKMR